MADPSTKPVQWLTTAPNPRLPMTGYDAGQRGWKLHAVLALDSETFQDLGRATALCGLRPSHGWDLDMFIQSRCIRCIEVAKRIGQYVEARQDRIDAIARRGRREKK
jgi:hypothetical protein